MYILLLASAGSIFFGMFCIEQMNSAPPNVLPYRHFQTETRSVSSRGIRDEESLRRTTRKKKLTFSSLETKNDAMTSFWLTWSQVFDDESKLTQVHKLIFDAVA
jgi:hypothetical protein